ncbi:small CPxCG-related zinc finger protein [Natrialba magadii ATCC 43099]|uniref:Small CPxCG-related zinc finger protein n=1 Tax=Natrialba magadii (strain ATCC 43099 / DSM 3394 / CCM 3739 / CIP 104546 / IAM 13178 / JCM 8861 / NBRC 102185 / NCIMB 2190 / MS3) TaxID=547559 RepID=D3SZ63_NATMM|nr:small CPxCG-related zinc finger protein [Natrialba magadii ATCC 43099]ELY31032.1 hypothetical protein C500_06906 [Natrialba magadii ATCC 43099]
MAKSRSGQHDAGQSRDQGQGQDQNQNPDQDDPQLLSLLEGRSCPACATGELECSQYKDNRAAVCDSCGTPQAQVWSS